MDKIHRMKATIAALFALATIISAPAQTAKVFYAMDSKVVGPSSTIQPRTVARMMESLMCGVTGKATVADAWKSLVTPEDKVGIKVSASGRSISGTNPEVVDAIVAGLHQAGVPSSNIIVWDRNLDDLLAAGFKKDGANYTLRWVDGGAGYDKYAQISAPIIGKLIWGDRKFGDKTGQQRMADRLGNPEQLSSSSYYAKVLSTEVTKVINVPSLTDSFMTGINGGLTNMTISNVDNWRRFAKAASEGDTYIAEIYADAMIHDKVVLTILDALILQFAGGPFPNPDYCRPNYSIFASKDPIAIDATAFRLIEEVRKDNKMPSIRTMTNYVEAGSQLGLGQYDESRIKTIRVGIEGIR